MVWLGALLSVARYASTVVYTHIDVLTEVINEDAERAFIDATGEQPLPGGRRVDTWSMCFQGGTFDRVKERCDSSLSVAVRHICAWTHKSVCIIHQLYRCRLTAYCIFHIMHRIQCVHVTHIARCSGDFPQVKISKYTMGLPPLPEKVVAEKLGAGVTDQETAVASGPWMYGRIWLGQCLAFDEAYQILQEHV